jgi:hypothetical protein
LPLNCTAEHGRSELPFTVNVNVGEPDGTDVAVPMGGFKLCEIEVTLAGARLVVGVVMVKGMVFELPVAEETETPAVPANAVSVGKIVAVSCVELTNVVCRIAPFQFTNAPLAKFCPVTVSVIGFAPQYGAEGIELGGAAMAEITGGGPAAGMIVKFTTFDSSVVVVADVLDDPETAEPGI